MKTRLERGLPPQDVLDCYLALLNNTLDAVEPFNSEIWYEGTLIEKEWTRGLPCYPQRGEDLGKRMQAVFEDGCPLLIGADCPVVTTEYLRVAFEALVSHDLVLGPVEDGGYFLIGMHHAHKELFSDMPWSTSEVLTTTLSRAQKLGLTTHCLSVLWDVDEIEDYRRWLEIKT